MTHLCIKLRKLKKHYIDILPFLCYNNVQFVYLQIKKGKSLCFIIFYS